MISAIWALLQALPDILKLIQTIQKGIAEANTKRKVADDISAIHEAFAAKDADKLNAIFKSN